MKPDTIVLHHSAIPFNRNQTKEIIASHLRNPRILQKGAYHYLVQREPDGDVTQLHEETFLGHHAGNYAVNTHSIGICVCGDLTTQQITDNQLASLTHLIMSIQQRWGIPDQNIKLHREVRLLPTACPGIDLRALYFARREVFQKGRIEQLEHAKLHAKGERLSRISRTLDRLLKLP